MTDQPLLEAFEAATISPRLQWHCPPERWQLDPVARCLQLWTDSHTDYWQRTHYGFRADNGHLLYLTAAGDFQLETRLILHPLNQYDQAGLMVWLSPSCWIKTSLEFEPEGDSQLGAVVTNAGYSDWSTQPLDRSITRLGLKLELTGQDVIVHASVAGRPWQQLRVAPLLERRHGEPVRCGLYACSPQQAGLRVDFDYLKFEPLGASHSPASP